MKEIILTKNQVTLVDDEDYDKVKDYKWYATERKRKSGKSTYYARRWVRIGQVRKIIYMHRALLNTTGKKSVDHRDGDGLNNTRSNLRLANHREQGANRTKSAKKSSGFKGVSFHKKADKWRTQIRFNGKGSHLGYFSDEKEAAAVYDMAAIELFGEFANLNFKPPLSFLWT